MTAFGALATSSPVWLASRSCVLPVVAARCMSSSPVMPTTLPAAMQANTMQGASSELGSPRGIPGCSMDELSMGDIRAAHSRIKQFIPRSPLDYSHKLSQHGCSLFLKVSWSATYCLVK